MKLFDTLYQKILGRVFKGDALFSSFMGAALKMSAMRAFIIVLSFVGSVALTRSIGPEGRGLIAWFIAAASIAMMFAQSGFEVLNRRYTAERPELAGGLALLTLKACLLGTLIVIPFFLYFAFSNDIGRDNYTMIALTCFAIFFMAAAPCLNSLQLGINNTRDFMWGMILQKVGNVVLIFALIWLDIIGPETGFLAFLISYILQVGMAVYSLRNDIKKRQPAALAFALSKKRYMLTTYIRNIMMMAAASIVPIMLGLQHSLAAAGWFAACMIIIDAINKTFGMISTYALPQLARTKTFAEKDKLKRNVQLLSFWGMTAIAIVWAGIAGWAIPLILGNEFEMAVNTFRILCLYMVFSTLADTNQAIVMAATDSWLIILSPLVMLVSVASVGYALIPSMGADGGAIALVVGALLTLGVSWMNSRKVHAGMKATDATNTADF